MKKLTYDYIKDQFKNRGYTLVSTDYKNSRAKLDYICANNHICKITYRDFQTGRGCLKCGHSRTGEKKRLSFYTIEKSFKSEGYEVKLPREGYTNVEQKLIFICPSGHMGSISYHNWNSGHRCATCGRLSSSQKNKLVLANIKMDFEKENYILLSKDYKNAHIKLDYICSEGHRHSITWNHWQQGRRCPYCACVAKLNIEEVKNSFENEGYAIISKEYINSKTKLKYLCPKGHVHSIKWSDWRQGRRCPTCHKINKFGAGNPAWKGGISFEPYCEEWKDIEYKQDIKDRDENKCLNPYCDSPNKNDLTIHHIDYNKKNCKPSNLITICRSCNSKANKDRNWHETWYKTILNKRNY